MVRTGLYWPDYSNPGVAGLVLPRSGLALRHGVTVLNAPGLIDPDFTGEVCVILINHGNRDFEIKRGDRIAQLMLVPFVQSTQFIDEGITRIGGLGSTGV
jgi:dUTP pyrophosphatase